MRSTYDVNCYLALSTILHWTHSSIYVFIWASLVALLVRDPPAVQETWVWSLVWEDPLEKGMATHSSILVWRIHGQKSLAGCSPWSCKDSDTSKQHTHTHTHKPWCHIPQMCFLLYFFKNCKNRYSLALRGVTKPFLGMLWNREQNIPGSIQSSLSFKLQ